jgi:hypothetical protein
MLHAYVERFDVMGGRENILGWDGEVNTPRHCCTIPYRWELGIICSTHYAAAVRKIQRTIMITPSATLLHQKYFNVTNTNTIMHGLRPVPLYSES